jgi:hypothetical protein
MRQVAATAEHQAAEHPAALADRPKDRAAFYSSHFETGPYCLHRACERASRHCNHFTASFLVGLAPADRDAKAALPLF